MERLERQTGLLKNFVDRFTTEPIQTLEPDQAFYSARIKHIYSKVTKEGADHMLRTIIKTLKRECKFKFYN